MLGVPLLREGIPIGAIALTRRAVKGLPKSKLSLSQPLPTRRSLPSRMCGCSMKCRPAKVSFRESLQYQTAISDVLNVISRSPSDIQPVLDAIAETAQRLCQSEQAYIFQRQNDRYHLVAAKDALTERIEFLKRNPIVPDRGSAVGRVALERRSIHILDARADPEYTLSTMGDRWL